MVGASHNENYKMFLLNQLASEGVVSVAETGSTSKILQEMNANSGVLDAKTGDSLSTGAGDMEMLVKVDA